MDSNTVFGDVPTDGAWWDLHPVKKHRWLTVVFRRTLDQIKAEGREPDDWESHCLVGALGYGAIGFYTAGYNLVAKAFVPIGERSPEPAGPLTPLHTLEVGYEDLRARSSVGTEQRP